MPRYEMRGATLADEEPLLALAAHLNTVNLPNDRGAVVDLLAHAERSFSGELPRERRKYVFLIWDRERARAVGTSTIISQLGRRDAPYIYLDVLDEERYSSSLDRHFHHTLLRLGFSYDGPTELGGLVVDPAYRRMPERLGRFASYCRFAYIVAQRSHFRDQLLAELLPPLETDGTSHLWEALGRRFTGLTYAEADRLSSLDKEFVRDLFPLGIVNTSLMDPRARAVLGQVGQQTLGVERMLERIGFRYARRIDPFDGGPHFVARTDEVTLVRRSRRVRYRGTLGATQAPGEPGLVLRVLGAAPFALAVQAEYGLSPDDELSLSPEVAAHLQLGVGDELVLTPLSAPSEAGAG